MSYTPQSKNSPSTHRPSVLVTGASSGIGLSTAILLSNSGFLVYAGTRTKKDKNKLELLGKGQIKAVQLDIRSDSDIADTANLIDSDTNSALVALVNNAGICKTNLMEQCSRPELLDMFDVNAVSPLMLSNAVLPLLQRTGGKIINIGSTSSNAPSVLSGAYCASKAALAMLSRVMRIEYSVKGVSVISIQPGVVATPFWTKIATAERLCRQEFNQAQNIYDDDFENRQQLLKSFAESGRSRPDNVAAMVLAAIVSSRPKHNYIVGADAKMRLFMLKLLPQWLYIFLASRKLKSRQDTSHQ